ncbi:MAG: hypothetical protein HQ596_07585 [Candidatus Saganbacteria bacterium]|nr:hypothetical protein [Candidatus Saganbacteria bacterium]
MNKTRLVILESIEEAKYFVDFVCSNDQEYKKSDILSLSPDIRAYLDKNGINSLSSAEIAGFQSYQAIMDKCEELETHVKGYIRKNNIEVPEDYFVNTFFFYLRLIWRHFMWDIELLNKCLMRKKYGKIIAFKHKRKSLGAQVIAINEQQLYMGDIAEKICQKNELEFTALAFPTGIKSKGIARISLKPGLFVGLCSRIGFMFIRLAAILFSKKKSLLISSPGYNLNLVCEELVAKKKNLEVCQFYVGKEGIVEILRSMAIMFCVLFSRKIKNKLLAYPVDFIFSVMPFARHYAGEYKNAVPEIYLNKILGALEQVKGDGVVFGGINYCELLRQKLSDGLIPFMLRLHFKAFGLKKALEIIKPNYVFSQMNAGLYGALGLFAKKANIPSVLISHGSHIAHKDYDKYAAREHEMLAKVILVGDYKYLAVQSPHARELAAQMSNGYHEIICIKPTLWGRSIDRSSRLRSNQFTVVYAATFKLRHDRRYIYETSDEFIQSLKDLCEVIKDLPDFKLIIKYRNNFELSCDTLEELLPISNDIVIENKRPFLDVLKEADLLVSFSSTTIEESLSNKVPVLLYGGQGRYSHIPCDPFSNANNGLNKAVTFIRNKDDLMKYFVLLSRQASAFKVPDQEFAKHRFGDNEAENFCDWFLRVADNPQDIDSEDDWEIREVKYKVMQNDKKNKGAEDATCKIL